MTKFEPMRPDDHIEQITVQPIENGYLVKRYTTFTSAIIHCDRDDLVAVFESALSPKRRGIADADASEYLIG